MTTAYSRQPHRKKVDRPQDRMLADFLRAPTAEQKREVIEQFNTLYFLFTPTKEQQNEQVEV
jgi:hypothetical protein